MQSTAMPEGRMLGFVVATIVLLTTGCAETTRQIADAPMVREGNQPLLDLSEVDRPSIDVDPQPLFPPAGQPAPRPAFAPAAPVRPVAAKRSDPVSPVSYAHRTGADSQYHPAAQPLGAANAYPRSNSSMPADGYSDTSSYSNAQAASVRQAGNATRVTQRQYPAMWTNDTSERRDYDGHQFERNALNTNRRHTVSAGETYSEIATYYDVDLRTLLRTNKIAPPFRILPGQTILIPQS